MATPFDKASVLARVKKMMTLANDAAATEGERDNALRMAHATLAKYNLNMAEADAAGTRSEEARERTDLEMKDYPWMATCANAVAGLFFCNFFTIRGRKGSGLLKYCYVGKGSNVYTAMEMTKYVISSIDKEARKVAREMTGNAGSTYWRSFCRRSVSDSTAL